MFRLSIFGTFRLADESGSEIPIKSRKARALLAYLALPPGKPRSREQIMALLWSDRGDQQARSSLRQALSGLRKDLGERGLSALRVTDESLMLDPERVVVEPASPGDVLLDGLHLTDPAFEEWLRDERLRLEDVAKTTTRLPDLPLPDKPSIAVLPFTNLSADPDQEYFSDGITEDIITALSRISGVLVVSQRSTKIYKGKTVDVGEIGREQGVRYVLKGSVRKAENRIRITVQLIDATTDDLQWAEHYDHRLGDIFEIQDDITKQVTTELNVQLARGEEARIWARGTSNLEAWEKLMRAIPLTDGHVREQNAEARRLAREAVELDPKYGAAWVALGWTHFEDALWGWAESRESSIQSALNCAKEALESEPENSQAFGLLATIHMSRKDAKKAIETGSKVIALSPNHADNIALAGMVMILGGEPDRGLPLMKRAMRLSPIYPQWYSMMVGIVHHILGDQEEAIRIFRGCVEMEPDTALHRLWLASALVQDKRIGEAQSLAAEILEIDPEFSTSEWVNGFGADEDLTKLLLSNLEKAGLPS